MSNASCWSASSNICNRITDYLHLCHFILYSPNRNSKLPEMFFICFVTSVYADVYSTWLFSCVFRLYRREPVVSPSSTARQQLQELYTQVPQVKLHFSHGFIFSLFDILFLDLSLLYLIMMTFNQSLISVVHTRTCKHAHAHTHTHTHTGMQSLSPHEMSSSAFKSVCCPP